MFLNTDKMNEGGFHDKNVEGRKRELHEGENPKSTSTNWNAVKAGTHVNSNWQRLRK